MPGSNNVATCSSRHDVRWSVAPLTRDTHVANLESQLRERLGTKVHLRYAHGKGALEITFFSDAELERILQILGVTPD